MVKKPKINNSKSAKKTRRVKSLKVEVLMTELTPIRNPTLQDYINAGVISPAKRKYDPKIDKPLANPDGIDLVAELLAERAGSRY